MLETHSLPAPIERRGNWLVLGRDQTLKRVSCKCSICSHICQIGAAALESFVLCSGCEARPPSATPAARPETVGGAL
jgi:hypothetical protein